MLRNRNPTRSIFTRLFRNPVALLGWALILVPALLSAAKLPPREEITFYSDAYSRCQEMAKKVAALRSVEDFSGLDALAAELRNSKISLANGTWLLSEFYDQVVSIPRHDPAEAERALQFYERWAAAKPLSITAQVALADAWVSYAWVARGSGYSDTVTAQGSEMMEQRLTRAWEILQHAALLREKCPHWAGVAQTVALGQGWNHTRYFEMIEKAIAREPTYMEYHRNVCYWLLPRWYGEEGSFEKWIAYMASASPEGDLLYARLVWQADCLDDPEEMVFAPGRLDWARAKRGFAQWVKAMPESLPLRFAIIHLSLLANDREEARQQFDVTGGKYWPANWHRHPAEFEAARHFAYGNGRNPLRETAVAPVKRNVLTPQTIAYVNDGSHLLGGLIAGILCLVFAWPRKKIGLGWLLLVVCLVLAYLHGTLAAAFPCLVFFLVLILQEPTDLPPPIPPRWGWALFWVIVLLAFDVLSQTVASLLAILPEIIGMRSSGNTTQAAFVELFRSGKGFTIGLNAVWLSLAALLVLCGRPNRRTSQEIFGFFKTPPLRAALWIALCLVFIWGTGWLTERFLPKTSEDALNMMRSGIHSPVVFFLALVIVGPIFEEMLMRGYAYSRWLPKFGIYWTALFTSVLFAVAHVQYQWQTLIQIFCMGLALVWLRRKTGSLYPSIVLHMLINLIFGLLALFADPGSGLSQIQP